MSGATTEVKRVGYAVAIGVNVLLLVGVNNILAWGWFPWLTPEFGDVLPILNLALVFNIVVSVLLMFYDEPWLKSITQITDCYECACNSGSCADLAGLSVRLLGLRLPGRHLCVRPRLGFGNPLRSWPGHLWDDNRGCNGDSETVPTRNRTRRRLRAAAPGTNPIKLLVCL